MIRVMLYGLASFVETGTGIYVFGKIFPKREKARVRHYTVYTVMAYLLMLGIYKMTKFMGYISEENRKDWAVLAAGYAVFMIAFTVYYAIKGDKKVRDILRIFLFIIMCSDLTEQYWMSYQSITMMILGNWFPPLYLYFFYECSFVQAYLWETAYVVNIGYIKAIYIAFIGTFQNQRFEDYFNWPGPHTWAQIIFFLIICAGVLFICRQEAFVNMTEKLLKRHKRMLGAVVWMELFLLMFLSKTGEGEINQKMLGLTLIAVAGLILGFFGGYIRMQKKITETENNMVNIRYAAVKEQYEELKSTYEGYRCLVHDEKHLISYVEECLESGNMAAAREFLKSYRENTVSRNRTTWTGIPTIDFMLNIKNRKMTKDRILFKLDAQAETVPMEDTDCIMLLGNLFDNAIEAADRCPEGEKTIFCTIRNINSMFLFRLKNSSVSAPVVKAGRFSTSKAEKEKHGWGIESVKRIVEKYEGEIEFQYDSSYFEVTVMIGEE